jgi:ABC-type phosphate transport system auxiliary subunit
MGIPFWPYNIIESKRDVKVGAKVQVLGHMFDRDQLPEIKNCIKNLKVLK